MQNMRPIVRLNNYVHIQTTARREIRNSADQLWSLMMLTSSAMFQPLEHEFDLSTRPLIQSNGDVGGLS